MGSERRRCSSSPAWRTTAGPLLVVFVSLLPLASGCLGSLSLPISAETGGTVLGCGGVRLIIPPGALAADAVVSLAAADVPGFDGMDRKGAACRILPDSLVFQAPATLRFPFDGRGEAAAVYRQEANGWRLRLSDDPEEHDSSVATIAEAGTYALFQRFTAPCPPHEQCDLPACPEPSAPLLTRFFLDVPPAALLSLGSLTTAGIPRASLDVMLPTPSETAPYPLAVRSPVDGWVTHINCLQGACMVTLRPCADVTINLPIGAPGDLLAPQVQGSADLDRVVDPPLRVSAGDLLGRLVTAGALQYEMMTDRRVVHPVANPARADHLMVHAVCPIAETCAGGTCRSYMSAEESARELAWVQSGGNGAVSAAHPCGVYPEVRRATALGPWHRAGPPQTSTTSSEVTLWLIHSPDGTREVFAQGASFPTRQQPFANVSQAALEFDLATSNGSHVNDDFTEAVAGPNDGPGAVHCYEHLRAVGTGEEPPLVFLLQMLSPTTMRAEAVSAARCAEIARGEGHDWVFPGVNAVVFER